MADKPRDIDVSHVFKQLDVDEDGVITGEDLMIAFSSIDFPLAWQLIAQLDQTGDGSVSLQDLEHFVETSNASLKPDEGDEMTWMGLIYHLLPQESRAKEIEIPVIDQVELVASPKVEIHSETKWFSSVKDQLDRIQQLCLNETLSDWKKTRVVNLLEDLEVLLKTKEATRPSWLDETIQLVPSSIGIELKRFRRSSLLQVPRETRDSSSVSMQQVKQASRIRAFRKKILSQLFPKLDDNITALVDLFPDLNRQTVEKMYNACDQDLHSCFDVLSGLSEYTAIESQLSPKKSPTRYSYQNLFAEEIKADPIKEVPVVMEKTNSHRKSKSKKHKKVKSRPKSRSGQIESSEKVDSQFLSFPISDLGERPPRPIVPDDEYVSAIERFFTAQDMPEVLDAFGENEYLHSLSTVQHNNIYATLKDNIWAHMSYRQKQLWTVLDAKMKLKVYTDQPASGRRIFIVGAGPVGLRCAIELAMLGAQVVIIEKRGSFRRENILHLWPWVVNDLTALGAKVLYPQFCASSAYFHIGTRELQCLLLKVSLLLGVKVYPKTSFVTIVHPPDGISSFTVRTDPLIPEPNEYTGVLGAGGLQDPVASTVGLSHVTFNSGKAIGLVAYFPNTGTREESDVAEFSWALQFNQPMFAEMRKHGLDLENIVYYRGSSHYFVMTPLRANLLDQGVLKENLNSDDMLARSNIDCERLKEYARKAVAFFKVPQLSDFDQNGIQLFDFSTRQRTEQTSVVLRRGDSKFLATLVGDALMEPFWPEGLGINRGFLSALDTCWMITQLDIVDEETMLCRREHLYRVMQRVSGFSRSELQPNIRMYGLDPCTRYISTALQYNK